MAGRACAAPIYSNRDGYARSMPLCIRRAPFECGGTGGNVHEIVRPQRALWMDIVRCFAIFLVVLDHTTDQVNARLSDPLFGITTFNDAVGPFRMATLMFLSGLLLQRSLNKPLPVFVRGKVGLVGWPYVVWSVVLLSLLAATSSLSGNSTVDPGTFLRIFYNPPTYLWYLAYLLVFYLVALLLRRRPAVRTALIPLALVTSQALFFEPQLQRMLFLLAFFLFGETVARHGQILERVMQSRAAIFLALLIAAATAVASGSGYPVRYQSLWALGAIGGIVVLISCAQAIDGSNLGNWMARYGEHSIIFYVTHWSFFLVAYHALVRVGVENEWLLLLLVMAAAFGGGFFFIWLTAVWPPARYLFALPLQDRRSIRA